MDRLAGKVAFITGAARGQGRAMAVRFAEEGADIIALDVCADIAGVPYSGARPDDLAETARLVTATGARCHPGQADVRDLDAVRAVVDEGVAVLGGLDIVVANAGIGMLGSAEDTTVEDWDTMIDVNLGGAWKTVKVTIPHLKQRGGGSIVVTSSAAGIQGPPNIAAYVAAKHGLIGLMKALANELAPFMIRANTIHPAQVATTMILNDDTYRLFRPDLENPGPDDIVEISKRMHNLPIPWLEPLDVANAALFLASDEGRYVTGVSLPVDAGMVIKTAASY